MPKNAPKGNSSKSMGSRGSSTSRPSTPVNTGAALVLDEEDGWLCKLCMVLHTSPDAKLLECDRCRDKFCIKCLNKTASEYEMMKQPDIMWFCLDCREKVEKNIATDIQIEERCREIMMNYEQRICDLEEAMKTKVSIAEVKKIVAESISEAMTSNQMHKDPNGDKNESNPEIMETLMMEVNERKNREGNIIFFGVPEINMVNKEDRNNKDISHVKEMAAACGVILEEEDVKAVRRLGKFDTNKMKRPLLTTLKSPTKKINIFRNANKLKDTRYKEVRITNDLTKAERDREKELYISAKKMQENDQSGDFLYKVRGPPWARKVVKIKTKE